MNTYKPIKRRYIDHDINITTGECNTVIKEDLFVAVGQMNDGHLVYCRCDKERNVYDYDEQYYQYRALNHKMYMGRI